MSLGDTTAGGQLADIRLETGVPGTGRGEGVGEVAGATSDVEHSHPVQARPPAQQRDRVGRESTVEPVGVGLLDPEGPEQVDRTP